MKRLQSLGKIAFLFVFLVQVSADREPLFSQLYQLNTATEVATANTSTDAKTGFGYQVQISIASLTQLIGKILKQNELQNVEIFRKEFRILLHKEIVSATVKKIDLLGINEDWTESGVMTLKVHWTFDINWPLGSTREATAISKSKIRTELQKENQQALLQMSHELELLEGWVPDNILLKKVGQWVLKKGIELAFDKFSEKINEEIHKNLGPMVPRLDGEVQRIEVADLNSSGNTVQVEMSPLFLTLKGFLFDGGKAAIFGDLLTVDELLLEKERILIKVANQN